MLSLGAHFEPVTNGKAHAPIYNVNLVVHLGLLTVTSLNKVILHQQY
jgi:hypothetical protein